LVENPTQENHELIFEHQFPSDSLQIYIRLSDGQISRHKLGYKEREMGALPYRNPSVYFKAPPGIQEVYFRLHHVGIIKFDIKAWTVRSFYESKYQEETWIGIFLGVAAV